MSLFKKRSRPWTQWQIERLAAERRALKEVLPDFSFVNPSSSTAQVRGNWTSNAGRQYTIVVQLGPAYPDAAPSVYVMSPYPLLGHRQKAMHTYGTSHSMHTFASDMPRATKLCTVRPEAWDASWTIPKIIQKAQLWLLAYEFHCDDGRPIEAFLLG
jgi:ubiquitin-protein ligase